MGSYNEDTSQNFGAIFIIILFSFFLLASSGNPEGHASSSANSSSGNELVSGDISNNRDAIIFSAVSFPDPQKYCDCTFSNTNLIPFSIRNKISDCDRRTAQNYILIQKTRLTIEPVLSWKLFFHLPTNEDESLPVLS